MVFDVVASSTAGTSALVALLSLLVSRRTAPGQAHVILSESELDERLRGAIGSRPRASREYVIRGLRNELAHSVITTDYDRLLELAAAANDIDELPLHREALRDRARKHLAMFEEDAEADSWLEAAARVADAFLVRLLDGATTLEKLDGEQAADLGRTAAENLLAAARWSQVVGDRIDTSRATELLGITRQALAKRQLAGSVLGLPGRGTTWYPTWQFNLEAGEIRPEVREIIGAFHDRLDKVDPLVIASWATTPQGEDLDGETPVRWLELGRDSQRLRLAAERAAARMAR